MQQRCLDSVVTDRLRSGQLAQLVTVRVGYYGDMFVMRCWISQQALQPDLSRSRIDNVDTSDYVSDPLQVVVNNDGKLVRDEPVPAVNDEVTRFSLQSLRDSTLQSIVNFDGLIIGEHANGGLAIVTTVAARARVDRTQWTARLAGKRPSRTTAAIGEAAVQEAIDGRSVGVLTSALIDELAVPFKTVTLQGIDNTGGSAFLLTRRIDVFYS